MRRSFRSEGALMKKDRRRTTGTETMPKRKKQSICSVKGAERRSKNAL